MLDSLFLSKSPSPLLNFDGDFDGLGHGDVMCKKTSRKECIPVGCVPPSLYRTGDLCPWGLSPGGDFCRGEGLCPGGERISVQGGRGGSLSMGRGVSVQRGLCPRGEGRISVQGRERISVHGVSMGSLSRGDLCQGHPPPWTEWHTAVKTLPCPKLRLRAVKNCNL